MSEKVEKAKTPIFKKWWFWIIIAVVIIAIGTSASQGGNQANETTKTVNDNGSQSSNDNGKKTETKAKLTLDDGWTLDASDNPYIDWKYIHGYVSNNTDKDIDNYVQITFNAFDAEGNNIGTCLANTNTVSANGKWKFEAICMEKDVEKVEFKEITGF